MNALIVAAGLSVLSFILLVVPFFKSDPNSDALIRTTEFLFGCFASSFATFNRFKRYRRLKQFLEEEDASGLRSKIGA